MNSNVYKANNSLYPNHLNHAFSGDLGILRL